MKQVGVKWIIYISGCVGLMLPFFVLGQGFDPSVDFFPNRDTILTNDIDDVVAEEVVGEEGKDAGFAGGVDAVLGDCGTERGILGVYCPPEGDVNYELARQSIADLIKSILNYALSIIGLVAMAYLLYHAFLTLTAGNDDEKSKAGFKGIKYATIAIVGIGISRFIISLIFYLLYQFTNVAA